MERLKTLMFFIFLGNYLRENPASKAEKYDTPNTFFREKINVYFLQSAGRHGLNSVCKKNELSAQAHRLLNPSGFAAGRLLVFKAVRVGLAVSAALDRNGRASNAAKLPTGRRPARVS